MARNWQNCKKLSVTDNHQGSGQIQSAQATTYNGPQMDATFQRAYLKLLTESDRAFHFEIITESDQANILCD